MTQTTVTQIDREAQEAKSKEGKYLTFAFLEKDANKKFVLDVVGWTELEEKLDKSAGIIGTVRLWEHEIPVKCLEISPSRGAASMASTACIVIVEISKRWKQYSSIIVDAISNVMVIAEKDPETVTVIETKIEDAIGGDKVRYSVVEKNQL